MRLTILEIQEKLISRSSWSHKKDYLFKDFSFNDFKEAFEFMKHVAKIAEELNHHPKWYNEYNKVSIELTTHDDQGITQLDFEMALKIDQITLSE